MSTLLFNIGGFSFKLMGVEVADGGSRPLTSFSFMDGTLMVTTSTLALRSSVAVAFLLGDFLASVTASEATVVLLLLFLLAVLPDKVLEAGFFNVGETLMGAVAEGDFEAALAFEAMVFGLDTVGLGVGGDLRPPVAVDDLELELPVGEVLPEEGGLGLDLVEATEALGEAADLTEATEVTEDTEVFLAGKAGGDSGGSVLGGGGGGEVAGEAVEAAEVGEVTLSNWDFKTLKFLLDSVRVAACLTPAGEAGEVAVEAVFSKIEMRSLMAFLTELMVLVG